MKIRPIGSLGFLVVIEAKICSGPAGVYECTVSTLPPDDAIAEMTPPAVVDPNGLVIIIAVAAEGPDPLQKGVVLIVDAHNSVPPVIRL